MAQVLSTIRASELMEEERRLLADVAGEGAGLVALMGTFPAEAQVQGAAAARFLYRRWVLEILLLLRVRGPQGFNEIGRGLGGPAGESLAPKLQDLVGAGLVEKQEATTRPRRTSYRLTPPGTQLGAGVYALTIGKSEHARAVREGGGRLPFRVDAPSPAGQGLDRAFARFSDAARRFTELHARRQPAHGMEEPFATARRFTEACVHKWHGAILFALAARGPLRFRELREAVGAGDQALSDALAVLVDDFGSVERRAGNPPSYAVTSLGRFDLFLGVPLSLMVAQARGAVEALQPV